MSLEITTLNESALEGVVKESGLQINEGAEIKGAYLPFLEQFADIVQQSVSINAESPTKQDEKLASDLRKKAVKIRTGAEALKDDRKKIYLIKGNLEQASFNVIKNSCLLAEESLRSVEEFSARQEAARKLQLKEERTELLSEFCDNPTMYPLAELTEEAFDELLNGFRLQKEAKEKAEQDRIAAEKLLAEQKEKERIAYEAEQERIRIENDKLKKAAEAKEKELQKERELAAKKLADEQAKAKAAADKLKAESDAKLKAEQDKAKKLADELKAKQDAEAKIKADAKIAEDKRIAEEKKLAKAPDKDKLILMLNDFSMPVIELKSAEAQSVYREIGAKLEGFKKWAKIEIDKL